MEKETVSLVSSPDTDGFLLLPLSNVVTFCYPFFFLGEKGREEGKEEMRRRERNLWKYANINTEVCCS
jgi:hypothetical protein